MQKYIKHSCIEEMQKMMVVTQIELDNCTRVGLGCNVNVRTASRKMLKCVGQTPLILSFPQREHNCIAIPKILN